ncbi:lectin subunit alpha-like [Rhopalosiphum maidis]|uniref:lectin subunit alpha-like n=1 Tax=Rhopalosiphum maidis TaxID=43146 RepID=UPI000EFF1FA9|nr:lectin subunit alpha-like [Rhopalosiphum maidis]
MPFSIRNVFIIFMTVFIFSDMTHSADNTETFNTSTNTVLVPAPVVDWHVVKSGNKNFYIQTYFKANWFKAMEYCHFHGMQFASITSEEENKLVVDELNALNYGENSHFWISGNDLSENNTFIWLGNGQTFKFKNWLDNEPNDRPNEDCVEYWYKGSEGFKWNDEICDKNYFFICEF